MTSHSNNAPIAIETINTGYPRAPWGKRALAFFIDSLIAGLMTTILFALLIYVMSMYLTYQQPQFLEGASEAMFYIYIAITILSFFWLMVYSLVRDGIYRGQSVGKLIFGLMVIHIGKNQPCNFIGSVLRNLPGLAAVLISIPLVYCGFLILLIEPVAALIHEKGFRLGDRWAKTQVIEKKLYQYIT